MESTTHALRDHVRWLDGLVRYRFGDSVELMGAWASARDVEGPFKSHAEEKPAGSEVPGAVASAA